MRSILLLAGVAAAVAGLFFAGWLPRRDRLNAVTAETKAEVAEKLGVTVALARVSDKPADLILPATISGIGETPVYARAEGYIKKRYVDIGDYVKPGQVLVEIDSPEQDQQLRSARARLEQLKAALAQTQAAEQVAQANLKLATVTAERVRQLVAEGVSSKQQGDEVQAVFDARQADVAVQRANINAARENIRAQEAEVGRIEELTRFQKVTAPFAGLITVRNCAVGNLITPSSLQQGRELFRLTDITTLRVFVNAPQADVGDISVGQQAIVTTQERPDAPFVGKVVRTANALDAQTRTLLTEVNVPNQGRALLPGMYAQVRLGSRTGRSVVIVPGDTLVTGQQGARVAVIEGGRVKFRKVQVGRDLGNEVEITSGLKGGEQVVVNPSDDVRDGRPVNATRLKKQ